MCILIQKGCDTVMESFKYGVLNGESSNILKNVVKNRGKSIIFKYSKNNPLITTTPERVKLTKKGKPLSFSLEAFLFFLNIDFILKFYLNFKGNSRTIVFIRRFQEINHTTITFRFLLLVQIFIDQ